VAWQRACSPACAAFRDFFSTNSTSGDPSVGSVRIGNKEITYRPENLERMLSYAEQRAAQEAGFPPLNRSVESITKKLDSL
jgi:hypothetical protein